MPRTSIIITALTISSVSVEFSSTVKRLIVRLSINCVKWLLTVPRARPNAPARVVIDARPSTFRRLRILRSISPILNIFNFFLFILNKTYTIWTIFRLIVQYSACYFLKVDNVEVS